MKTTKFLMVLLIALLLFYPATSKADSLLDTIYFEKFTNNGNPDVSGQLYVEIWDTGPTTPNTVGFKFFNTQAVTDSSIAQIYFDDGALLGIASITNSGDGVNYTQPATPGELPSANTLSPVFVTSTYFGVALSAGGDPNQKYGVDEFDEWVLIKFDLESGKTPASVLAALAMDWNDPNFVNDGLRIGLHVQSIGNDLGFDGSDSYVNKVPEPGILILLGIAMSAIGVASWKIRKL